MGLLKIEIKSEKVGIKKTKVIHQTKNMNKEKYFVYLFTDRQLAKMYTGLYEKCQKIKSKLNHLFNVHILTSH